jgi:hypothetical protein
MKRRVFTILSAVSLVLCVAMCVLWARSYRVLDSVVYRRVHDDGVKWSCDSAGAAVGRGGVFAYSGNLGPYDLSSESERVAFLRTVLLSGWGWHPNPKPTDPRSWNPPTIWYEWLGFRPDWQDYVNLRERVSSLIFPMWALVAPLAVMPAGWIILALRRGRHRAVGLCPACGYDLRASKGECPECGAKIAGEAVRCPPESLS